MGEEYQKPWISHARAQINADGGRGFVQADFGWDQADRTLTSAATKQTKAQDTIYLRTILWTSRL